MTEFTNTIASLIACYRTDPDSHYGKLRYATRLHYDGLCRRIEADCTVPVGIVLPGTDDDLGFPVTAYSSLPIEGIRSRMLLRWHEYWSGGGKKITVAHSLIGMLRTLMTFGATILEDAECKRVKDLLSDMRFPMSKPRKETITADQVIAIRRQAHAMGWHSIALAQAFQFEIMLRQKDVIGEWLPFDEPGVSGVVDQFFGKWLRGLRFEEIDDDLILRHVTSKRGKVIEVDLKLSPMVCEELAHFKGAMPSAGPVIVYERTDLPYLAHQYRRTWRLIARMCDVPDTAFNMDSRASGITEATDAGANIEHVRHAATHSNIQTTQGYSRNSTGKIANVQRIRSEHRNAKAVGEN